MAEIIDFQEIVRARTRHRGRVLTARCLDIMEACLARTRLAYDTALPADRPAWGAKVRQLEGLVEYAASWL
ncbi:MAG: hypothetical protein B6D46_13335 [Polyangiaceae bacterium UTPRO1]|jgi:hypothetical protein|nr:hypothetical protein [Myxococcales bacterium]OQY65681.1 MAG: hypothetical protein B6D46_13335 [Polyangiaceae bacterium UTPRO1]